MKINKETIDTLQFRVKDHVTWKDFGCQISTSTKSFNFISNIIELDGVWQLDELVDILSEMRALITKERMKD